MNQSNRHAASIVTTILSSIPKSLDDAGTADMLSPSSWPDWATNAVTFRDLNVETGRVSRPGTQTRFFSSLSEYHAWMAASVQAAAHGHQNACRQVYSYQWDLGPEQMGTRPVHMYAT